MQVNIDMTIDQFLHTNSCIASFIILILSTVPRYKYCRENPDNKNNKAEVTMGTVDKMSMMNEAMTNLYRVCAKIDQLSYQC